MPRNIRNFWIKGEVDGRQTPIAIGPKNRLGGFKIQICMRANKGIVDPVEIVGEADEDGWLTLTIVGPGGKEVLRIKTHRDGPQPIVVR